MTLSSHSQPLDDGTTVTGTIVFGGACAVDDTIVIVDAAGTSKTFTAKGSTTAGSLQFINTDAAAAATALKLCIDNAAGFGENSITVTNTPAGTITLTLASPETYRFKNKASITPASDITNVTSTDFGAGGGAEDIDGHTIVGGGTVGGFNSKGNTKSNVDTVKGRKMSGSKVILKTGTATKPGIELARSGGTLAYNPQGRSVSLSTSAKQGADDGSDNFGWLIRGGVGTLLSGIASTNNLLAVPGSDSQSRFAGSVHEMRHYRRQGAWSDTILDLYNGKVYDADGNAKSTISGWGTKVELSGIDETNYDNQPTQGIPGELVILFNFASYATNMVDYSSLNG